MKIPVQNYQEAITTFGNRIGTPEMGQFFIVIERTYRNDESGQHKGAKVVKLYQRTPTVQENDSQIAAMLRTEFPEDSERPCKSPSGRAEYFEVKSFEMSENKQIALADDFAQSCDPYEEVRV